MVNSSKYQTGEPIQLNNNKHIVFCSTQPIVLVSNSAQNSEQKQSKEREVFIGFLSFLNSAENSMGQR